MQTENKKYFDIFNSLESKEILFILNNMTNKSCMTCDNGSCQVEYSEKTGYDELGMPQGSNCLGWKNNELIGKSKVLKIYDVKKLTNKY